MAGRKLLVHFALALPVFCSAAIPGQEKKVSKDAEPDYFVMRASAFGLAEVAMGKLAQSQSANPAVQKFAHQMVEQHTIANRELELLAKKYLLPFAKEVDKERQPTIARLSKLKAADFDRLYMSTMLTTHSAIKELFLAQSLRGPNADLKDFATRTLPVFDHHLNMARELASRVGAR